MRVLVVWISLLFSSMAGAASITLVIGHEARVDELLGFALYKDAFVEHRDGLIFIDYDETDIVTAQKDSGIAGIARLLAMRGNVLLVIDTRRGYDQLIFDHLLMTRQSNRGDATIYLSNIDGVLDAEDPVSAVSRIIRDTKRTMKEMDLSTNINVFHEKSSGAGSGSLSNGFGRDLAFETVPKLGGSSLGGGSPWRTKESGRRLMAHGFTVPVGMSEHTISIVDGMKIFIWMGGKRYEGTVDANREIPPGGIDDVFEILLDKSITATVPKGFFIEDQGRVVGGGAIEEIVAQ